MAKEHKTGPKDTSAALLKDAILQAAGSAGGKSGLVGYLEKQAAEHPGPYLSLMGKVLPMQIGGEPDHPIITELRHTIVESSTQAADER